MSKKSTTYFRSTSESRYKVWQDLAEFLAKVGEMGDEQLKNKHEEELGFPIGKWLGRENIITRIAYVMSKKVIDG